MDDIVAKQILEELKELQLKFEHEAFLKKDINRWDEPPTEDEIRAVYLLNLIPGF